MGMQHLDQQPPLSAAVAPVRTERFAFGWSSAVLVILLSGLFVLFAQRPLWHTDLWGHLLYGEIIWNEGAIPRADPIMPLAADEPIVDSAWLSQLIGYGVYRAAGTAGLRTLYAVCLTASLAMIVGIGRRRSRLVIPFSAAMVMLAVNWTQMQIIRPQLAGLLAFTVLLAVITRRPWPRGAMWMIPFGMALWANLHGSFVMGLGLLASAVVGRGADIFRRTGTFHSVWRDQCLKSAATCFALSLIATLVNPYGWRLWVTVAAFSQNPNLADLVEWQTLSWRSQQGEIFAGVGVALCLLLWFSPRRVSVFELLLFIGLGAVTIRTSRMIVWFAPVSAYLFAVHAGACWRRWRRETPSERPRFVWTVLASFAVVCGLLFSPLGSLGMGRDGDLAAAVSSQTPVAAAEFLNERRPAGQMFNTYEWGDYFAWAAYREGERAPIFVASHAHLIPRQVWIDYMSVIRLKPDWEERLARYDVRTVVIDFRYRSGFIERLKKSSRWRLVYEDDIAAIFRRRDKDEKQPPQNRDAES